MHQTDMYTPYEEALQDLLNQLSRDNNRYLEALTFQQRLTDNIQKGRRFGDTEELRSNRAAIIEQLNQLALSELNVAFTSFVQRRETQSSTENQRDSRRKNRESEVERSQKDKYQEMRPSFLGSKIGKRILITLGLIVGVIALIMIINGWKREPFIKIESIRDGQPISMVVPSVHGTFEDVSENQEIWLVAFKGATCFPMEGPAIKQEDIGNWTYGPLTFFDSGQYQLAAVLADDALSAKFKNAVGLQNGLVCPGEEAAFFNIITVNVQPEITATPSPTQTPTSPPTTVTESPPETPMGEVGVLEGVVTDRSGNPISDLIISIRNGPQTVTDSDGSFVLLNVPKGAQLMIVTAPSGQGKLTQNILVVANQISRTNIVYDAMTSRLGLLSIISPVTDGFLEGSFDGTEYRAIIHGRSDGLNQIFDQFDIWVLVYSEFDNVFWVQQSPALVDVGNGTWRATIQLDTERYQIEDGKQLNIIVVAADTNSGMNRVSNTPRIDLLPPHIRSNFVTAVIQID